MKTLQDIETLLENAKLFYINKERLILADMQYGRGSLSPLYPVNRLIRSLTFEYNAQVINSDTELIYNCLYRALGGFTGNYQVDPEVRIPGQTVITVPVVKNFNSDKIEFATTDGSPQFILSNYQDNYFPLYGNNPILSINITSGGGYTGDEQTPPVYTYATPGDPTSAITSILYDYPIATTGYLSISGEQPITGSGGGSGSGVITFNFTQDNLVDDGFGGYYLPLSIGSKTPVYTSINGVGTSLTYDDTFTPARLLGFANNATQSILVKVI